MTQADQRQVSPEAAIKAELGEISDKVEEHENAITKLRKRGVALEAALHDLVGKPETAAPKPEAEKPKAAEPKKAKKPGKTKKSSRVGEENKRRFRDFARDMRGEPFTYDEAAEALGLHRSTIIVLAKWAVGRGIVKRGKAVLRAGQQGRRPVTFTYVERVPEPPRPARGAPAPKDKLPEPPKRGGGPIPGTGGNNIMKGASPEVQELVAKLKDQGWPNPTLSGGGHLRIFDPQNVLVTTLPKTPSDHRSIPNAKAILKRAGAKV